MTLARPLLLGAMLVLGGCALWRPQPSAQAGPAWDARRALLSQVEGFNVQARVASGGPFGAKGNLYWRQRADAFDMRVSGPFGSGLMLIAGDARGVEIRTATERFSTPVPEVVLQERLGWTLPVSRLRWWALGVPAPGSRAEVELDEAGRAVTLAQDDWVLEYDEYRPAGTAPATLDLPRKFELANSEVTIKVVVDAWTDVSTTPPQ